MLFIVSTSGVSRNSGRISLAKLRGMFNSSASLEGKDRRKLRSDVVRCVAGNATKQRQCSGARIRARAVVPLLVTKRHPLVPFVLNIAGEEIATSTTQAKPPRIARQGLIAAVVNERGPTGVAAF